MRNQKTKEAQLRVLFDQVVNCQKCSGVNTFRAKRKAEGYESPLALMAQAPGKCGVQKSGRQWCDENDKLIAGGKFIDQHLRTIGYSVDPESQGFSRPYTTNVIHCWPGAGDNRRDRSPRKSELDACRDWWQKELSIVRPKILVLLGRKPAEAISDACSLNLSLQAFIKKPLIKFHLNGLTIRCVALPHPTAPFREKASPHRARGELYKAAFAAIKKELARISD